MNLVSVPELQDWTDIGVLSALLLSLIAFSAYWFLSKSEAINQRFFSNDKNGEQGRFILFTKYFGAIVMGLLPILVLKLMAPAEFWDRFPLGLEIPAGTISGVLAWTLGLGIPAGIVSYLSSRNPKIQEKYPEIRTKNWTKKLGIQYALSWFFYLLGYELMFRGVLFLGLAGLCGFWIALAINLVLYSATHIPKGLDEAVGALLIGFFLCIATWQTQSIWVAFLVHVVLSWTTNYFAWKKQQVPAKNSTQ